MQEQINDNIIEIQSKQVEIETEEAKKENETKKIEELESKLSELKSKRTMNHVLKSFQHAFNIGVAIFGFITLNPVLAAGGVGLALQSGAAHVTETIELDRQINEIEKLLSTARRNLNEFIKNYDRKVAERKKLIDSKENRINNKQTANKILSNLMAGSDVIREMVFELKRNQNQNNEERDLNRDRLAADRLSLEKLKDRHANDEKAYSNVKDNLGEVRDNNLKITDTLSTYGALKDLKLKNNKASLNSDRSSISNDRPSLSSERSRVSNLESQESSLRSSVNISSDRVNRSERDNKARSNSDSAAILRNRQADVLSQFTQYQQLIDRLDRRQTATNENNAYSKNQYKKLNSF